MAKTKHCLTRSGRPRRRRSRRAPAARNPTRRRGGLAGRCPRGARRRACRLRRSPLRKPTASVRRATVVGAQVLRSVERVGEEDARVDRGVRARDRARGASGSAGARHRRQGRGQSRDGGGGCSPPRAAAGRAARTGGAGADAQVSTQRSRPRSPGPAEAMRRRVAGRRTRTSRASAGSQAWRPWPGSRGCSALQLAVGGEPLLDEVAGLVGVGGLVEDVDDAVDPLADQPTVLAGVGGVVGELDPLAAGGRRVALGVVGAGVWVVVMGRASAAAGGGTGTRAQRGPVREPCRVSDRRSRPRRGRACRARRPAACWRPDVRHPNPTSLRPRTGLSTSVWSAAPRPLTACTGRSPQHMVDRVPKTRPSTDGPAQERATAARLPASGCRVDRRESSHCCGQSRQ